VTGNVKGKAMQKKIGKALVVGAGISGIKSALDLAENGYGVILIDRAPHLGGLLSQLDRQFPTNRCGMCKMLPLVERDSASQFCLRKGLFHENIEIRTGTRLTAVAGEPGHLKVSLRQTPTWVDARRCVGCGQCATVCPVETPDTFNAGLSLRKAVYLPVPHAIPNPYVIDAQACTRCGECEKVCPTQAIDLARDQRRQFRILVVDDELVVRDSLKEWLVDEGYSVQMADSGAQALKKLEAQDCHLMLADIKMPGMDGVELLKRAREIYPDLPVVMMTAYATVETAVDAMKIGARDYLMKPFDPEKMIPMVAAIYEEMVAGQDESLEVGAIVLACGTDYFDPSQGKNPYGYGKIAHVVTHLEFERLLSGTGPSGGRLLRPADGKPVSRIAFLQCVGSRDLEQTADFCSTACCLISVKEALLAKEKGGAQIDTAIFYMDMRAFGLPFQRFCDQAREQHNVRFERGRVHSIYPDAAGGNPVLRHAALDGTVREETFDLVVLAAGQRPAAGTADLAEKAGLTLNSWGFMQNKPFSSAATDHGGVLTAGSCTGLKDISESVIQASAAAVEAGRTLHAAGGSLGVTSAADQPLRDVWAEPPRILAAICTCNDGLNQMVPQSRIEARLLQDPAVTRVVFMDRLCTVQGWQRLRDTVVELRPNRLLVGACHPYLLTAELKTLAADIDLPPRLVEAVDLQWHSRHPEHRIWSTLCTALAGLKHINPMPAAELPVVQRALVVGGGIAGMQAALAIADQGYPVVLVEREDQLGGNLHWLSHTLEGWDVEGFLKDTVARVQKHPRIEVHRRTEIGAACGQVGRFSTILETQDAPPFTLEHGIVVLATGGTEAHTDAYGCGRYPAVITQKTLETGLAANRIDPAELNAVVMILCVGSREEPRNYCSRVCCATAIKQALKIKAGNPDTAVYVLYRDMMTYGFAETYFTQARQAGVIFTPYDRGRKPEVRQVGDNGLQVHAVDPILGAAVDIQADLVVLATGIQPGLPASLAAAYGAEVDADGFFKPADFKWRPVDALAQGVFACGISHSPRNVTEAVATARAAAQRALSVLMRTTIPTDKVTARVRHSLCSLCERCIETCPYGARTRSAEEDKIMVNPVMCQGCGACSAVCPNSAAIVDGFTGPQVMEAIGAVLST